MGRGLAWGLLVWIVLATPVVAQVRRELSIRPGEEPVAVFADRLERLEREQLVIATGHVEIVQGDTRLEADRVELNPETGEAVALGKVVFFDGRDRLLGERLEYNFRTGTGIVYRAAAFVEPHFFVTGERMERLGEKAYRIHRGVFTTCSQPTPHWSVGIGRATAYLDDYLWGTNASFWVWKIPLVPFVPFFAANLRKDRQTGFLMPSLGTSSTKGFTARVPFYWVISDSQDLTLSLDYFSKRGPALGAEYRYIRTERSRGEIEGYFLHDRKTDDDRWVVGLRHDEQLTDRLSLKADLARVSDDQYFQEFSNTLGERSRQRLESNLTVTQRWDTWNLVGNFFSYQDLTTSKDVELQKLPEVRLTAFRQPVPFAPDVLFDFEGSAVNFVRDLGSDGRRLDFRPGLTYPFSPGGYFTLTPFGRIRETVYDTRVRGTKIQDGVSVEDTEREFVNRTLLETGVDAAARAFRTFDMDGTFGLSRIQHLIEPRVGYGFVGKGGRDLPQFDGIDTIPPQSAVTYSLTNRLKARQLLPDGKAGAPFELARFLLSQSYDFRADTRPLSDITGDLIVQPLFGLYFRTDATYNVYGEGLKTFNTDLTYTAARWRGSIGTRHGQDARLQFVRGEAAAQIGQRWAVRGSTNYNAEAGVFVENRVEVEFRHQCWAIGLAVIDRVNEDEVHVTVNLLELGSYGFGRAFAGIFGGSSQ